MPTSWGLFRLGTVISPNRNPSVNWFKQQGSDLFGSPNWSPVGQVSGLLYSVKQGCHQECRFLCLTNLWLTGHLTLRLFILGFWWVTCQGDEGSVLPCSVLQERKVFSPASYGTNSSVILGQLSLFTHS